MVEREIPPAEITPLEFFTRWVPDIVQRDPVRSSKLGETDATLEFEVTGDGGGTYTLRVEEGAVTGDAGKAADPDLRIKVDVDTWRELNSGALSAPVAFVKRRVHLQGNLALAVKLHLILG